MKILFFLIYFTGLKAFALEAVVTVLETPLLQTNNFNAPVVQYLRKGDVVKIHPVIKQNLDYEHLAPSEEKFQQIKKELSQSEEWKQDLFLSGKELQVSDHDEFLPIIDRQGHVAYVIRKHLYIYYDNKKELSQEVLLKDPTDYRLEEPLLKNYPLYSPTGYRGQMLFGLTQPYTETYPYPSKVKLKGSSFPIEVSAAILRQTKNDKYDRYYFGAGLNFRTYSNSFMLFNGVETQERGIRLGVGPYLSYDAFKGVKNRINLFSTINVHLFNQVTITQKNNASLDQRDFRTITLSPKIGLQYHRKKILEDVDFVISTSFEMEPATTFRSNSAANQVDWWDGRGNDKFKTRATFALGGLIGLQSAY